MQPRTIAATTTLALGTGAIGAAWLLTPSTPAPAAAQPTGALPAEPEPRPSDLFTAQAQPSPAKVFFDSVDGRPMPAGARQRMQGWMSMMEQLLTRMDEFDLNGDGMLGDLERAAMGMMLGQELLAEYDLDGDGELSGEEWRALQRDEYLQTPQGQRLMQRFDANADGVLSEEEQAALDMHLEQERQRQREESRAQIDTDGDGQVSEDERRAARQQERDFWRDQMSTAENEFDYDGDGELNIEETHDAWDAWVDYQTIDDFINRYDADGNRSMGPADYENFLSDYDRKNPRADVNNDGEVDIADIHAFRNLVLRSRSF